MRQTVLGSVLGEPQLVEDPAQARLLADPVAMQLFSPFLAREVSASQAAREAKVSVERMLYRVAQFCSHNLLKVVREDHRAGRPVRIYRSVADAYRVPFHLTPYADLEAMLEEQTGPTDRRRNHAMARLLRRQGLSGRLVYRDAESGNVHTVTDLPLPFGWDELIEQGPAGDFTGTFWLEVSVAREVATRFRDLLTVLREAAQPEGSGQPFQVQVALTPLEPDDLH
ncbi:hypothetical protein [Deinococcus hohokamensis]|uniref:Uncharacterized protein n=1 Tax=Deinococcus hohokamensis TaxID=309883 RepID=A0ABV9I6F1_9DEIO